MVIILKQVNLSFKKGTINVEDVPPPQLRDGGILIQTAYSLISIGTEKSTVDLAKSNYLQMAKKRPELTKKVMELMKKNGIIPTMKAVLNQLDMPEKLGYSCSGYVIKVGKNIESLNIGDKVACSGVGYASHSEINFIPKNLFVKIPDNVDIMDASYVAVGAIAIQAIRNAKITLGENVAVIGLGLLGLITIQALKAAGCRVFGYDVSEEKVNFAKSLNIDNAVNINKSDIISISNEFTGGHGFDAVIITASTTSNQPIVNAGKISRDKGRVVIVGDVGTNFLRKDYYEKELDLIVSRSYGPGRYDKNYEEMGLDYPYGYIRWTEQRNMEAFLDLVSKNKINLNKMTTNVFPREKASEAYSMIVDQKNEKLIGVLLEYRAQNNKEKYTNDLIILKNNNLIKNSRNIIGVVGSGSFAITTFLPLIRNRDDLELRTISSQSGTTAKAIAKKYNFHNVTTDVNKVFKDPEINKILILTRNSTHAKFAIEALENGKDVLVEKPPTVTMEELKELRRAVETHPDQLFFVDFNRRYSKWTKITNEYLKNRTSPIIINYRINGDKLSKDYWVYDQKEGGSRYISELCHFVDYIYFLINSKIEKISFSTIDTKDISIKSSENFVFTIKFKNGSIGNIIYSTIGSSYFNKEFIEIMSNDITIINKDFKHFEILKNNSKKVKKSYLRNDKGHREIINHFLNNTKPELDMLYAYEYILKEKERSGLKIEDDE
jgi:predicted dehydrogenase/threonine dehydrogenase-like Zn-dependent dehydrogenase